MTFVKYCLILERNNQEIALDLTANDGSHAQAQASDIARALKADAFSLTYEEIAPCKISELFRRLAYSDFPKKECCPWTGSYTNGTPAIYALKRRYYVRRLVQDYLDIGKDVFVMNSCKRKNCVNPFHNSYKNMKASKTTGADKDLALAFASQGVPVKEIAKALKVHTSTVYRILKHERFHSWTQS
jgi:hypothetical protein